LFSLSPLVKHHFSLLQKTQIKPSIDALEQFQLVLD